MCVEKFEKISEHVTQSVWYACYDKNKHKQHNLSSS